MVEEGQRDPEFETILDMVDPNRFVFLLFCCCSFIVVLQSFQEELLNVTYCAKCKSTVMNWYKKVGLPNLVINLVIIGKELLTINFLA